MGVIMRHKSILPPEIHFHPFVPTAMLGETGTPSTPLTGLAYSG